MRADGTAAGATDDRLAELCGAARRHAALRASTGRIDWRDVRARLRRRRGRRIALAAGAVLCGAAAGIGIWSAGASPEIERTRVKPAPTVPAGPGAPPVQALRPAPEILVVLGRAARVSSVEARELVLVAGTVWVRIDRGEAPRPFRVVTADAAVSVAGTRFAVTHEPGVGTTVAVLDGRVRVRRSVGDLVLSAGTQATPRDAAPMPLAAAWRQSLVSLLPDPSPPCGAPAAPVAVPPAGRPPSAVPSAGRPPSATAIPGPGAADGTPAVDGGSVPPSERRERPPRQAADVASSSRFAAGPEAAAAYATAEQAMREGRWADALPMLERVAAAEPGSVRSGNALMDLGRAAARAGREDLAARAYERYLAEQPGGPLREAARFALCRLRGEGGASCADTGVGSPE